jgi:hypothetical protein
MVISISPLTTANSILVWVRDRDSPLTSDTLQRLHWRIYSYLIASQINKQTQASNKQMPNEARISAPKSYSVTKSASAVGILC